MIHEHDKSPCKWSTQINGYCPYKEMLSVLVNTHCKNKIRCKNKECLYILLNKTGYKTEQELVNNVYPDLLKPHGPTNPEDMLSNINIDAVLRDFAIASVPKINSDSVFINGPFCHIYFDMRDFEKVNKSEFKNLDLQKLQLKGFKSFGCILNTDTWDSANVNGHWVAVFGILKNNTCEIEYFNSSGNTLDDFIEIKDWIKKKQIEFPNIKITYTEIVKTPLQGDTVNCGVWCLIYIKSRLEGKNQNYFYKYNIDDDFIDKSRKYLFTPSM